MRCHRSTSKSFSPDFPDHIFPLFIQKDQLYECRKPLNIENELDVNTVKNKMTVVHLVCCFKEESLCRKLYLGRAAKPHHSLLLIAVSKQPRLIKDSEGMFLSHLFTSVLVLAGIEFVFFIETCIVLPFGFVMKTVLITLTF